MLKCVALVSIFVYFLSLIYLFMMVDNELIIIIELGHHFSDGDWNFLIILA